MRVLRADGLSGCVANSVAHFREPARQIMPYLLSLYRILSMVLSKPFHRPIMLPPTMLRNTSYNDKPNGPATLQEICIKKLNRSINSCNVLELMKVETLNAMHIAESAPVIPLPSLLRPQQPGTPSRRCRSWKTSRCRCHATYIPLAYATW